MEFIENFESWTSQTDACRFCLSSKGTWDLFATYSTEGGENEKYSNIIFDCFGITLSPLSEGQHSCDDCVGRLRDAFAFKKQVQRSVELLTIVNNKAESREPLLKRSTDAEDENIKQTVTEPSKSNIDKDYVPDEPDFGPCMEGPVDFSSAETPKIQPQQISERKRIKMTCDTILRYTTACPFRHHKSWFRCFFCTQTFMDILSLRDHTASTHSNIEDQLKQLKRYPRSLQIDITDLKCQQCNLNLLNVDALSSHFKTVHDKMVYKECVADYKLGTNPYSCHLCNKQFHVFRTLTTHLNEHYANFICAVCGKSFLNSKRLRVHNRTHESGLFPCGECGKVLKTRSSLVNHVEGHSKRVLTCQICSEPMKHYNDRIKHMSEAHNITHTFKCPVCARAFHIKHYLSTHLRQAHGDREHRCAACGQGFGSGHGLRRHMLRHAEKNNKK